MGFMTQEVYLKARAEITKILPVIEWGDPSIENFWELAQDVICGYMPDGRFGWIRVTTNTHPTLNFEFLGASFEDALAAAQAIVDQFE